MSLVTVPPTGQAWIFRLVALPCPFRYLIAAFLVGIALAIRLAVAAPDAGLPFLTFFPATALSAILCGLGPGLVAAMLGCAIAGVLFLPPPDQGSVTLWSQVVFLADAALVCGAIDAMHRYHARYRAAIEALETTNRTVRQTNARLRASNEDLEQFAYVASHDLQEPLRMVAIYGQLLARRYKTVLDADAADFIGFMVEGATRMQAMVADLLHFSRLNRSGAPPTRFDSTEAIAEVVSSLAVSLAEVGASIRYDDLPVIVYDRPQFVRLMQNLIGNTAIPSALPSLS